MLEEELTRIAALVTTPEGTSGGLRARPRNGVPTPGGDRLDELTRWWSGAEGIGGVGGPQLPQRVEHFWLPHTGSAGPVRSEVVLHRFTAPRDPEDALDWGVATADDAVDDGTDLLLLSIPVPEDEATWQVAAAQVLGLDAVEAAGWPGPGQSDHEWIARVAQIRDGLKRVRGNRKDPYRLLTLLEHRELLAGTGLLLQSAARRTPAILDGPVATTCALLAARLAPAARSWWIAADSGRAVLVRQMLEELRLTAVTDLGLDDGDGVGARFALQLLETALLRGQDRNPEAGGFARDGYPEDAAELDGAVAVEAVAVGTVGAVGAVGTVGAVGEAEAAPGAEDADPFEAAVPVAASPDGDELGAASDLTTVVEATRRAEAPDSLPVSDEAGAADGESDSVVFVPLPVDDADFEVAGSEVETSEVANSEAASPEAEDSDVEDSDVEGRSPSAEVGLSDNETDHEPAEEAGPDGEPRPKAESGPAADPGTGRSNGPISGRQPDDRS